MLFPRYLGLILAGTFVFAVNASADEIKSLSGEQRLQIALEAVQRIESDPRTNAALQKAIYDLLPRIRGTPEFVQIVKKFNLKGQGAGLLEIAEANPASETGVEAVRLVLGSGETFFLKAALEQPRPKLIEAIGNAKDKAAVPLLEPVVRNSNRDLVSRKMAVRALAQTQEGAGALLELARAGTLPPDLRLTATEALNSVRWEKIKTAAAEVLPLPRSRNATPLPPLTELAKMKGDVSRGENIYFNEAVACASCHQVRGRGVEIGPNLSEIGTKLGREALLEAILDPSAGISFGFEAHQVELKSGDEAYGLLASETDEELAIKDLKGIVTKFRKSEVAKRQQLSTSIMPTGLAEGLSPQELVDLVEYLAALKKAN